MESLTPLALEFNFDRCSPPWRNFYHTSAPTSPSRRPTDGYPSGVPFQWEERPGTPKSFAYSDDFEFSFIEERYSAAEELFEKGRIRPLNPPPGYDISSVSSSPKTPVKVKDFDPFQAALDETRRRENELERGRNMGKSGRRREKFSRSLSPLRIPSKHFDYPTKSSYSSLLFSALTFSPKDGKKWTLRDLLLSRSASEGEAHAGSGRFFTGWRRDTSVNKCSNFGDTKNSSFSSCDNTLGGSFRKSGNSAVSDVVKRKERLPGKVRLLGCF